MTREEAIEVYNGLVNTKIKEAFEFFAPELRESMEERIRKALVQEFKEKVQKSFEWKDGIPNNAVLAWLEKQKDASKAIEAVDRIDKYIDEHLANAHDMKDSNPDKKYYRGWDDALGKMAGILQDVYSNEKQKEQNGEDEECADFTIYHPLKNGKGEYECIPYSFYGSLTSFSEDKDLIDFLRTCFYTEEECNEWIERQKEQKPISEVFGFKVGDAVRLKDGDGRKHIIKSFEEVEGVHGPNFYHVEFEDNSARDGIYPGEEYPNGYYTQMEKFEKEQKPSCWDSPVMTHEMVMDEQKPVEWSEEDEDMLNSCISSIEEAKENRYAYKETDGDTSYDHEIAWLKSLRPQPKQEWNEEDEDAITTAIRACQYMTENFENSTKQYEDAIERLKSLRPSGRTHNGLLKIKVTNSACYKYKEEER